jgi:DNA-binding transcriptional ArsR family regulator
MGRTLEHPQLKDVTLEQVLRALADPVRLQIVRLASRSPALPCNRFFEEIPKSTMSHHWRVLREAGLIRQEGSGTERLNSLRRKEIQERFPGLLKVVLQEDSE